MITVTQLMTCTGCPSSSVTAAWFAEIVAAMDAYAINTPTRQADFLANIGHESGHLMYSTEIWGPTVTQMRYEGRVDLGNTQPGDGKLYRGHGLIQVTGRFNHARARDRLRAKFPASQVPDFEIHPESLASPHWAALSAADFWNEHGCNAFSDKGDFDGVCDTINRGRKTVAQGDANGYASRLALRTAGRKALGLPV